MSLEDLTLEQRDELAALANKLANSPDTRKDFLRLTKKVAPNVPMPEIDMLDEQEKREAVSRDRLEKLENDLRQRDARDKLKERRQSLLANGKIKDEGELKEIEKLMLEKKIADHEVAADYYNYQRQMAAPTAGSSYNPNFMNEGAKKTLANYWKNPVTAARDEAAKAFQELRSKARPIGF